MQNEIGARVLAFFRLVREVMQGNAEDSVIGQFGQVSRDESFTVQKHPKRISLNEIVVYVMLFVKFADAVHKLLLSIDIVLDWARMMY